MSRFRIRVLIGAVAVAVAAILVVVPAFYEFRSVDQPINDRVPSPALTPGSSAVSETATSETVRAESVRAAADAAEASAQDSNVRTIDVPDGRANIRIQSFNGDGDVPEAVLNQILSARFDGNDRFETEPVDSDWAPGMESTLYSVASAIDSDIMEVTEVECRTRICRAVIRQRVGADELDDASLRAHFDRARTLIEESFRPLLATPNGRLKGIAVNVTPSSEQEYTTVVTLSGPPLGQP